MCYGTNCGREGAFGTCYHPEDCIMRAIERDAEENLAAQSWFFRNHKRYIGVDTIGLKRFRCQNTTHAVMSIQKWIDVYAYQQPESTFAICNYVPDDAAVKRVREYFPRLFCFYPAGESPLFW